MAFVIMGATGFAIIHLCDIAALRKIPWLKPIAWATGCGLLVWAGAEISISQDKLGLPGWLAIPGWLLLLASFYLLVHSLFVNLPFRQTYVKTGVGSELITDGLYALVRHPGVMWFVIVMLALLMVSDSSLWLAAAPLWITLDILLVIIQDRYFFIRMFPGYASYQSTTPMLLPNRKSWSIFIDQLRNHPVDTAIKTRRSPNE